MDVTVTRSAPNRIKVVRSATVLTGEDIMYHYLDEEINTDSGTITYASLGVDKDGRSPTVPMSSPNVSISNSRGLNSGDDYCDAAELSITEITGTGFSYRKKGFTPIGVARSFYSFIIYGE